MSSKIINSNIKNCIVGENVIIKNSTLKNCTIKDFCCIFDSNIEGAEICEKCKIGAYSRIRGNTIILKNSKIGNFVEIKNSIVGENSKIGHLAYVGDAEIGGDCNIGAGVVFANFDGVNKHKTKIADKCFIGSNSTLVAPLNLARHTFVACGSVVTDDSQEFDFIISRNMQITKKGYAKKYFKN